VLIEWWRTAEAAGLWHGVKAPPQGRTPRIISTLADGEEGARRRDGILLFNHRRLPDLRSGGECDLRTGDGLWVDNSAYQENKRAGGRQVYRLAGQDDHEPLHSLHALRPLPTGSPGVGSAAIGRGEDMEITTFWKAR